MTHSCLSWGKFHFVCEARLMDTIKPQNFRSRKNILDGINFIFRQIMCRDFGDIDYVYANELEDDDNGKLTGNYVGDIVDGQRKAELLRLIAKFENLDLQQVIAVGDGAIDLPILNCAGLDIAFHAKPKVKANAKQSISSIGLDGVLYMLGFKDSYIEEKK